MNTKPSIVGPMNDVYVEYGDALEAMLEYAAQFQQAAPALQDTAKCTPNGHNLDVLHIGACTNCGGNKIVHAERPNEGDEIEKIATGYVENIFKGSEVDKDGDDWQGHLCHAIALLEFTELKGYVLTQPAPQDTETRDGINRQNIG